MTSKWIKKENGEFAGSLSPDALAGPPSTPGGVFRFTGEHDPGTNGCKCESCVMGRSGFEQAPTPIQGGKSRIQAAQERARSGAYGTHGDRRLKRLNTRGGRKRAALKDFE
jgi:hypothetical protein